MKRKTAVLLGVVGMLVLAVLIWPRKEKDEHQETQEEVVSQVPAPVPTQAPATVPVNVPAPMETDLLFSNEELVDIPEPVRVIVGNVPEKGYGARMDAVHALKGLSAPEVDVLLKFLDAPTTSQGVLDGDSFNSVKNDVLEVLLLQKPMPADLATILIRMSADTRHDDTWRDYSVQFMPLWYEKSWTEKQASSRDQAHTDIENALWAVAGQVERRTAGTALLGLQYLSERYPHIDRSRLSKQALGAVTATDASPGASIVGLQLCAELGDKDALPEARVLAQAGEVVPLRMAAIGLLGKLGTAEDLLLLEGLAVSSDRLPSRSAEVAVRRLRETIQARP